jgi:hypothetical protein
VAFSIVGFCTAEVNPFGPVQLYVAPLIVDAVRFSVDPSQTGLLLPAVGAAGIGLTVTLTVPAELAQPLTVAITLYSPVAAVVAFSIAGFCTAEVNPFGPVQL